MIFATFAVQVIAAAQPEALAILDDARRAMGGVAWERVTSQHLAWSLSAGGLTGQGESWESTLTGHYQDRYQLGPSSGAVGFDGKVVWEQDSAKQVRETEGAESRQLTVNEAYRRSRAYWFPERWPADIQAGGRATEGDRQFRVVRITPRGGRPFDLWVDEATHLLDRVVEKGSMETRTSYLSDYRSVEGVRVPFRIRTTNGEVQYDQIVSLTRAELNAAMPDSRFGAPPDPAPDFALVGGAASTQVPFEIINDHIYVEVWLNGSGPFRVLCDTGATGFITPALAKQLNLHSQGALQGRGAGEGTENIGLLKIDRLQLGDATLFNQLFATFPMDGLARAEGIPEYGLIGYELFRRFVVTVDYVSKRLTLTVPSAFTYIGKGTAVPFKFKDTTPQVEGDIDGVPAVFDIDTGSRSSVDLLTPFVEAHALNQKYPTQVEGITGWGIGGPTRSRIARAGVLRLGGFEVKEPLIHLSLQKAGVFTDPYGAGNVGTGVLRRFNIIFDYAHKRLIFEPNANFPKPEIFDRSGTWLIRDGPALEVVDVIPGGPAAQAGVKRGDLVLAVDGEKVENLSLSQLRGRFRTDPPGTRVRLTLRAGNRTRDVTLELRELV